MAIRPRLSHPLPLARLHGPRTRKTIMTYHSQSLNSPAGLLHMICDGDHLLVLAFDSNWPALCRRFDELQMAETPVTKAVKQQLGEYFTGSRRAFTVPVKPQGTAFQTRVWEALLTIPYGRTASYRDQATRIGKPQAARAVGHANGQNPISIDRKSTRMNSSH